MQAPSITSSNPQKILITGKHVESNTKLVKELETAVTDFEASNPGPLKYSLHFEHRVESTVALHPNEKGLQNSKNCVFVQQYCPSRVETDRYRERIWHDDCFATCDLLVEDTELVQGEGHENLCSTYAVVPAHIMIHSKVSNRKHPTAENEASVNDNEDNTGLRENVESQTTSLRYIARVGESDFELGHPALFSYRQWRKWSHPESLSEQLSPADDSHNSRAEYCPEGRCPERNDCNYICPHKCLNDIAIFRVENATAQQELLKVMTRRKRTPCIRIRQMKLLNLLTNSKHRIKVGEYYGRIVNYLYTPPITSPNIQRACGYQLSFVLDENM